MICTAISELLPGHSNLIGCFRLLINSSALSTHFLLIKRKKPIKSMLSVSFPQANEEKDFAVQFDGGQLTLRGDACFDRLSYR